MSDESLSTLASGRVNGIDYDKVGGVASLVENNTIDVERINFWCLLFL